MIITQSPWWVCRLFILVAATPITVLCGPASELVNTLLGGLDRSLSAHHGVDLTVHMIGASDEAEGAAV